MNQIPRVSFSPLLLPAGGGAIALVFSLVADIEPINPEFFALVAQILPLLLLATLLEPSRGAPQAQSSEAPTPSAATSSSDPQVSRGGSQSMTNSSPVDIDSGSRPDRGHDPAAEETEVDPAELQGLDLDELMALVMPKIKAAQAKFEAAQAELEEAEERRVRAAEELDKAQRRTALAKAHYAKVRHRATVAIRVAIWAMFPGEAAALYAVASRQYTTFLAIFCGLSVLTTFWLVAETWIDRALSAASVYQRSG